MVLLATRRHKSEPHALGNRPTDAGAIAEQGEAGVLARSPITIGGSTSRTEGADGGETLSPAEETIEPEQQINEVKEKKLSVFVRDSDAVISGKGRTGFVTLSFPLLAPTEDRVREFLAFGVVEGQEPSLIEAHVIATASEVRDMPLLLNYHLFDTFDQIVVTVPQWSEAEKARIVVSVSMTNERRTLSCSSTTGIRCSIVDYTSVDPDGFLIRSLAQLDPGESKIVPVASVGLVYLESHVAVDKDEPE